MRNFVRDGNTMPTTAPTGGVASGDAFLIGETLGVAAFTAAEGEPVEAHVEGVFALPKASADDIGQGVEVFWDSAAGEITTTALGNVKAGIAFRAAGAGATTIEVKLAPGANWAQG